MNLRLSSGSDDFNSYHLAVERLVPDSDKLRDAMVSFNIAESSSSSISTSFPIGDDIEREYVGARPGNGEGALPAGELTGAMS